MCGIAGGVGVPVSAVRLAERAVMHRGPDARGLVEGDGWALAHRRLAILDLDDRSACPFARGRTTLVWNGELWNFREIRAELELQGERFTTTGDTEVVAAALERWGVDALPRMEGMFACAWSDGERVFLARDRFGEVPLHVAPFRRWLGQIAEGWLFCSELKGLAAAEGGLGEQLLDDVEWVGPGEVWTLEPLGAQGWTAEARSWYHPPVALADYDRETAALELRTLLDRATTERAISDVPVCCLVSGGVDSTAVLQRLREIVPGLVAYTAVYDEQSADARAARHACAHLDVDLVEVRVPLPNAAELGDVVRRIEMPHKAQVEIGWACLHLARRMRADGMRVCLSGEGSDELWASYGFSFHALRPVYEGRVVGEEARLLWREYRRDTFLAQHRKNFARCNKVFLAHGVECRLPFLHTAVVEFGLSLDLDVVVGRQRGGPSKPKEVMYSAFADVLPDAILKRHKVAFQEGMGLKYAIAEEHGDAKAMYMRAWRGLYERDRPRPKAAVRPGRKG